MKQMLWLPVLNSVTVLVKYRRLTRYKKMLQTHTNLPDLNVAASDGGGYHAGSRAVETFKQVVRPHCLEFGKNTLLVSSRITWRKCWWNLLIFPTGICSVSRKRQWDLFGKVWKQQLLSGPLRRADRLHRWVCISTGSSPNVQGSTWVLPRARGTWGVVGHVCGPCRCPWLCWNIHLAQPLLLFHWGHYFTPL